MNVRDLFENYTVGTVFKPGKIYLGVPNEVYHSEKVPGVSRSRILEIAACPQQIHRKRVVTKSFEVGDLIHTFFNEPHQFHKNYFPDIDKPEGMNLATKAGIAWKNEIRDPYYKLHYGKKMVSKTHWKMLKVLHETSRQYKEFKQYDIGLKEVVILVEVEINGVKFLLKLRSDSIDFETPTITDLKSTYDISDRGLRNSKTQYFYDVQAWLYSFGWEQFFLQFLNLQVKFDFNLIFAEKTDDHPEFRFDKITPQELELGKSTFLDAFDRYTKAKVQFEMGERVSRYDGWESIGLAPWVFSLTPSDRF